MTLHAGHADPAQDDETQEKNESKKGTNTLVYVPFSEFNSHEVNLDKREMDVWIPG